MPTSTFIGKTFDARPDRVDLRDRPYAPRLISLPPRYPDDSVIQSHLSAYEADGMILDQGSEGACTGFGLAAAINYLLWIDARKRNVANPPKVSPRMLYHLARFYDEWPGEDYEGSSCRGAMKGWHRHGVCGEDLWPYRDAQGRPEFVKPDPGWEDDAATRPLGAYYRVDKNSIVDMQSAEEAERHLRAAHEAGIEDAAFDLGVLLILHGGRVREGIELLKAAAENGISGADEMRRLFEEPESPDA